MKDKGKTRESNIMKNKYILIALVVFQLAIVGGMLLMAMLPLLTGQPVQLEVTLRDPRDMFRGNYVDLFYDISRLPLDSLANDLPKEGNLNFGDELFVSLKQQGDVFVADGVWQHPPENRRFIKGIVAYNTWLSENTVLSLNYGIESYFTDPKSAKEWEERLRFNPDSTFVSPIVTAMVDGRGNARIKSIGYK